MIKAVYPKISIQQIQTDCRDRQRYSDNAVSGYTKTAPLSGLKAPQIDSEPTSSEMYTCYSSSTPAFESISELNSPPLTYRGGK